MYEKFNKTLHQKIEIFGKNRMEIEKKKFEEIIQKCDENPIICFPSDHHKASRTDENFESVPPNKQYIAKQERINFTSKNYGTCFDTQQNLNLKVVVIFLQLIELTRVQASLSLHI